MVQPPGGHWGSIFYTAGQVVGGSYLPSTGRFRNPDFAWSARRAPGFRGYMRSLSTIYRAALTGRSSPPPPGLRPRRARVVRRTRRPRRVVRRRRIIRRRCVVLSGGPSLVVPDKGLEQTADSRLQWSRWYVAMWKGLGSSPVT